MTTLLARTPALARRAATRLLVIAGLLASTLLATPAAHAADDGDDYAFVLLNKSTVDAIQFYTTRVDGSWSNDWLKLPVKAGAQRALRFNSSGDTRCTIRTRVVFADASEFNSPVGYCGISTLVVTDKNMFTQ